MLHRWNEVLTTHPAFYHFEWALVFAVIFGMTHYASVLITKSLAPSLMGYSPTPPLPKSMEANKAYIELGEACHYTQSIDTNQLSTEDLQHLSANYCQGKLTVDEVSGWFKLINRHHADIAVNERRFQECLFPIFTKGFSMCFGVWALYDKSWVYDRSMFYHVGCSLSGRVSLDHV